MDHANFQRYVDSQPYKCIGGRVEKSPMRFTIPLAGQWHVVVDKIGFQTLANSNVRAIAPTASKSPRVGPSSSPATSTAVKGVFVADKPGRPDSEAQVVTQILNELNTYKQIANTDVLTGLANRRAFDAKLEAVFKTTQNRPATALILSDIDHFKSFNDTYGHAIGDTVLKIVAETIRKTMPANAFPARTGGEEFAIIVEATTPHDANLIAEATRKAIQSATFIDEASGTDCGTVTISLGVCMANQAESIADLYNKSDLALYASKDGGRNRYTVFEEAMADNQSAKPATANTRASNSNQANQKQIQLRL